MNDAAVIVLLGASSAVGRAFIERTAGQRVRLLAVSRRVPERAWPHVTWLQHDLERSPADVRTGTLVSFGPLAHALSQVEQGSGLGRVIALSPAATQFAAGARERAERRQADALARCERALADACARRDIVLTILKPTEVYGGPGDAAGCGDGEAFSRLSRVPVAGRGLRAPVHADDLARLAVDCVVAGAKSAGSWLLAGGETLAWPDMVRRLASAEGRSVRLVELPPWMAKLVVRGARLVGRMPSVSPAMIERQAVDRVVDDTPAREQLAWQPRPYRP